MKNSSAKRYLVFISHLTKDHWLAKQISGRLKMLAAALLVALAIGGCQMQNEGSDDSLQLPSLSGRRPDITFNISPDNEQIVFSASGKGSADLYLLNLNTAKVQPVTQSPDFEFSPAFSPNGNQIVYAASSNKRPGSIFTCSVNGTGLKRLTNGTAVHDAYPSFSPAGSDIVFVRALRNRPYSMGGTIWDRWDIHVVKANGTGLRRVTRGNYRSISADFSADGKAIVSGATQANATGMKRDILVVDGRGTQSPQPLTQDGHSSSPSYSFDGKQIAFISDRAKAFDYEVWRMNADGTRQMQVTHNGSYNLMPRFRPGARSIIFLSDPDRENRYELWEIGSNGGNLQRIAGSGLFDNPLRWKPNSSDTYWKSNSK